MTSFQEIPCIALKQSVRCSMTFQPQTWPSSLAQSIGPRAESHSSSRGTRCNACRGPGVGACLPGVSQAPQCPPTCSSRLLGIRTLSRHEIGRRPSRSSQGCPGAVRARPVSGRTGRTSHRRTRHPRLKQSLNHA